MDALLSYLPYALITTFTPGPNNLMSLYAVSQNGWERGSRVISGIGLGFACITVLLALFCHELAKYIPALVGWLKYAGAAYILWLAVHIARSGPDSSQGRSINFWSGFLLAISNVKMILYTITVYTAYVIPKTSGGLYVLLIHGAFMFFLAIISWAIWGSVGGLLQKFLAKYYRPFNITMGIILVWCAVSIVN